MDGVDYEVDAAVSDDGDDVAVSDDGDDVDAVTTTRPQLMILEANMS